MALSLSKDGPTRLADRPAPMEGRRICISGTVQGVGFRPWVYRTARLAGVTGRVRNDTSGVTIDAFGSHAALSQFLEAMTAPPPAARILRVDTSEIASETCDTFDIAFSQLGTVRRVSIPPDLATCPECVSEIFDPQNRRYRYAFTNCTHCGPRFTIATDIPYDRATTTMASFEMCPACRREYLDVNDRRFHAQPNACPVCGPQLMLRAPDGVRLHADDVVAVAARAIADGLVVAIKGIGGFHLACDATSDTAVRRLRQRKRRDEKPVAVMVRTIQDAARLACVDEVSAALLTSTERPIVLAPRRAAGVLADSIAPNNQMLGLMLPYSPLHHLLLADAARPLVMTSGNLSDEPIAIDNDDALQRLGNVADVFVIHDRDIVTRCDDSVIAVIAGAQSPVRRSRGYVPRAVGLVRGVARPVLACGALLKNTFCLAEGENAWLGPHIGDLDQLSAYSAYVSAIERMERFLGIHPEAVGYDMHPDYLSSAYARSRSGVLRVPVQHHHAHVVSAMTEHGIEGSAIGIAYDGSGFGTDGTMWGGELLVADTTSFTRAATFRPIALAGGDLAVREPWRIAVALIEDAFDGQAPESAWALLEQVAPGRLAAVRHLLRSSVNSPRARGVGRYFDGFGALFLSRAQARYEGQLAIEWNQAADPDVTRSYPFDIRHDVAPWELDLRPALRAAIADRVAGEPVSAIAAAFHNTIAEATATLVGHVACVFGSLPVVASGGCFQNARLAESVRAALAPEHDVRLHQVVPPGDGGLALGQAVIADAITRTQS